MEHSLNVKIETPVLDFWNRKFVVPVKIEGKEIKEFEVSFAEIEINLR